MRWPRNLDVHVPHRWNYGLQSRVRETRDARRVRAQVHLDVPRKHDRDAGERNDDRGDHDRGIVVKILRKRQRWRRGEGTGIWTQAKNGSARSVLVSGGKGPSLSESVTAPRIFARISSGESVMRIRDFGSADDLVIFLRFSGSPLNARIRFAGSKNRVDNHLLHVVYQLIMWLGNGKWSLLRARFIVCVKSLASSRCCRWSSPTGICVALCDHKLFLGTP